MYRACCLLLLCFGVFSHSFAQPVYKWVDAKGEIHISQQPAPEALKDAEYVEVFSNVADAKASGAARRYVRRQAEDAATRVTAYTTTWCPNCERLRHFLKTHNVPFEELDVEQSEQGLVDFINMEGRGVPIIVVGQERIDGFDEQQLKAALQKAGYSL